MDKIQWLLAHKEDIYLIITSVIGTASVIVKLTPSLKDDNFFLPIIKFLGKYVSLNKSVRDEDRPQ